MSSCFFLLRYDGILEKTQNLPPFLLLLRLVRPRLRGIAKVESTENRWMTMRISFHGMGVAVFVVMVGAVEASRDGL